MARKTRRNRKSRGGSRKRRTSKRSSKRRGGRTKKHRRSKHHKKHHTAKHHKKHHTAKRHKKRKVNEFFKLMLDAKKHNKQEFRYKGKRYKAMKTKTGMTVYKKA